MVEKSAPGFFGKLRSHGDFVGRRLPPAMRDPFDAWLQAALLRSRHDLGSAWTPVWLSSPLWRFVLAPGVCGDGAWAGVMMPSLDRVGRCFPLVLAAPCAGAPALAECLTRHAAWFARLEDIALSSLDDGFSLDAFDAALLAPDGAPTRSAASAQALSLPLPPPLPRPARVTALADGPLPALVFESMEGASAWWGMGSAQVAPSLACSPGLPVPALFAAMLDGDWRARGWVEV
jgi:type VI secretion system protein ImpM